MVTTDQTAEGDELFRQILESKRTYYDLVIEAESPTTEIWLADNEGHPVQQEFGVFRSSLIPGDYVVEFGLGSTTYPISLKQNCRFTEAEIIAGPSCTRPIPDLLPESE